MVFRLGKPYGDKLATKWVSPQVSGGEDLQYTDPSAPAEGTQAMENGFMSPLDSLASEALAALETGNPAIRKDSRLWSAWLRFLMSLMMRMPDHLETLTTGLAQDWARQMPELEATYEARKGPDDPRRACRVSRGYLSRRHSVRQSGVRPVPLRKPPPS